MKNCCLGLATCVMAMACSGPDPGAPPRTPEARLPFGDLTLSPESRPVVFPGVAGDSPAVGPMLGIVFSSYTAPDTSASSIEGEVRGLVHEGMSLLDADTGAVVQTDVHDDGVTFAGFGPVGGQSLTPTEPLAPGWYVFRADLTPIRAFGLPFIVPNAAHEGDVLYARFHIGPEPIWVATSIDCASPPLRGEDACDFVPMAGMASGAPAEFAVLYDGVPAECDTRTSPGIATTASLCPMPARGTRILIRSLGSLTSPSGATGSEVAIEIDTVLDAYDAPFTLLTEPDFAMDLVRTGAR